MYTHAVDVTGIVGVVNHWAVCTHAGNLARITGIIWPVGSFTSRRSGPVQSTQSSQSHWLGSAKPAAQVSQDVLHVQGVTVAAVLFLCPQDEEQQYTVLCDKVSDRGQWRDGRRCRIRRGKKQ